MVKGEDGDEVSLALSSFARHACSRARSFVVRSDVAPKSTRREGGAVLSAVGFKELRHCVTSRGQQRHTLTWSLEMCSLSRLSLWSAHSGLLHQRLHVTTFPAHTVTPSLDPLWASHT